MECRRDPDGASLNMARLAIRRASEVQIFVVSTLRAEIETPAYVEHMRRYGEQLHRFTTSILVVVSVRLWFIESLHSSVSCHSTS
jgi:hypothetical protein